MNIRLNRCWLGCLVVFLCLGGPHAHAQASSPLRATMLTIAPTDSVGQRPRFHLQLATVQGGPVRKAKLILLVNNQRTGQLWTDATGQAVWRMPHDLPAGQHTITAIFAGQPGLQAVRTSIPFTVAATRLSLQILPEATPLRVGHGLTVAARLTNASGTPIPHARLVLSIPGARTRELRTADNGQAFWSVSGTLVAGSYTVMGRFAGIPGLLAASASMPLTIAPAVVAIQTVPAVPGVRFALGDQVFVSDQAGLAQITVARAGTYRVKLLSPDISESGIHATFVRWGSSFAPELEIRVPLAAPLQAGFHVRYLARQTFVDRTGQPIDAARVTSMRLSGSDGSLVLQDSAEPRWLPGNHVIRLHHGLVNRKILYTLRSAIIDGSNVVNAGQQRFYADTPHAWQVQTQLYTATFVVRDALFGVPIGSTLHLTYPDNHRESWPLGADTRRTVGPLARGLYTASVDAPGIASPMPLAMIHDLNVTILVLSYLDLGVAMALAALVGFGLLFIGRPGLLVVCSPRGLAAGLRSAYRRLPPAVAVLPALAQLVRGWPQHLMALRPPNPRGRFTAQPFLDPVVGIALVLVMFGIAGFGIAGVEARIRRAGGTLPPPPPVTTVAAVAPRPVELPPLQTRAQLPTPAPTPIALPTAALPPSAALPAAGVPSARPLAPGSDGPAVEQLQQQLRVLGYFEYPHNTGHFGLITRRAVAQFQADRGLPANGIVGQATRDALHGCGQECVRHPSVTR